MTELAHRRFKDALYGQLARVGKALANPHRLELLELLSQGPRNVDDLAQESALSLANASQHLLALKEARLVESTKHGIFVEYRLASESVFAMTKSLHAVAEDRLADLERLVREHFSERDEAEAVSMNELLTRAHNKRVVILDARPASEYAAGHIAGALSLPYNAIKQRLDELPRSKEYVAYCRGPYCVYADRAVEILKNGGRRAFRLSVGFPEWKAAGHPVAREEGVTK